jgi:sortase A
VTSLVAPGSADTDAVTQTVLIHRREPDGEVTKATTRFHAGSTKIGGATLVIIGLAVWFLIYAFVLSALQEHGSQARLYEKMRVQLAEGTAPTGGLIKSGAPVALISLPAAGLHDVVVVQGTTSGDLSMGPGHLANTPLPGQVGTSVIFGRSVTFGGPFGSIGALKPGAKLTITTGQGAFTYRVEDVWRPGSRATKPRLTSRPTLTLVTSDSSGWRSGWAPSHTVNVDAQLLSKTNPSEGQYPLNVTRASLAMQGNSHAFVPFVFWVEGLVLAALLTWLSWVRWGKLQTWIVASPALIAMLWGASGALMALLPNLI